MENEKKQDAKERGANHSKPRHHGRRKGYFIQPANAENGQPVVIREAATAQNKPAAPQNGEKRSEGDQNRDRNHHHSKHRPNRNRNDQKPKVEQTTPEKAPVREGEAARQQDQSGRNKHKQKNRNRNQNKNQNPIALTAEATEVEKNLEAKNGERSHHHNRGKHHRDRSRPAVRDELVLTDTLAEQPSFFGTKKEGELAPDEDIIPYIPADDDNLCGKPAPKEAEGPLVEVVGIRFKAGGKIYYFTPNGNTLSKGSYAIVETARGQEYGEVALGNTMVSEKDTVPPLRPVLRGATEADIRHQEENKKKEADAFRICNEKIAAHELDMKLIDAQYTFDNTKLLFYFTSAGRVDFRELVKDLASVFRTRIELRQIGIRDEAKMMGGLGPCGRPLCCTLFLTDFGQVSIKMAKEQNLSLNSSKISGICGRLMCCLRYESEAYEYEIKKTPPVDSVVQTEDGVGVVTEINPLAGKVKVRLNATPDVAPKFYHRDTVTVLQRKQDKGQKSDKQDKGGESKSAENDHASH